MMQRLSYSWLILVWVLMAVALVAGGADDAIAPKRQGIMLTRAEIAAAYVRLERAAVERGVPAAERASINDQADEAAAAFFRNDNAEAVRILNATTHRLLPEGERTIGRMLAESLVVRIRPAVFVAGSEAELKVELLPIYEVEAAENVELRLKLRHADGTIECDAICERREGSWAAAVRGDALRPGRYAVVLAGDGEEVTAREWSVVARPLREVREDLLQRLEAVGDVPAAIVCRARVRLLTDTPSSQDASQFLADPITLEREVAAEVEAIEAGRDPYVGKVGDFWRVAAVGKMELPMRVYAPAAVVEVGREKTPALIIALHGAGGDENMFMDGYGGGLIKTLADEMGFVVVSPLTYLFSQDAGCFDAVVEAMADAYAIDRGRVYLLGHSMGAAAAATVGGMNSDKVAGVCCIAGAANLAAVRGLPRTLVIGAERDGIIPAIGLFKMVDEAKRRGRPVEFLKAEGWGHVLVVGGMLREGVLWLLGQEAEE